MEYRKLISFGKNSFVVSLPKNWVVQNKLVKGDLIYVDEDNDQLTLRPNPFDDSKEEKSIRINVDGKDIKQMKREIFGAYIHNNKTITLYGDEIKAKAKELQPIIQSLVALEVMEQTSKSIVAKDFLNIDSVSTSTIIRKMDVITRSMWEDCENMFEEDAYESINHRDQDVNKLTFLMFRIIRFGLEKTTYMIKKFNLKPLDLLTLWLLSYDLESVADEIKRIARYQQRLKISKKSQVELKKIIVDVKQMYLDIMKAYYDNNVELAYNVIGRRYDMLDRCEKYYLDNRSADWIGFLIERIKAAIGHITHIGRLLYQNKPYNKTTMP